MKGLRHFSIGNRLIFTMPYYGKVNMIQWLRMITIISLTRIAVREGVAYDDVLDNFITSLQFTKFSPDFLDYRQKLEAKLKRNPAE